MINNVEDEKYTEYLLLKAKICVFNCTVFQSRAIHSPSKHEKKHAGVHLNVVNGVNVLGN